jgi:putative N6-adenine-specific DNA methylase
MTTSPLFSIFLVAPPGLETVLCAEAAEAGFAGAVPVPGGVTLRGGRAEVMRANLVLRGASRVLVRIGIFSAIHLSQLDKRARKLDWGAFLRPDVPVKVEAICRKSKIYHSGAAAERVGTAIAEELGAPLVRASGDEAGDPGVRVLVRIENDMVTVSVDTSGEPLHRRGHKQAVSKAPMRENLAALFLHSCGFAGTEPVFDPMCGSGTFVIEAAEMALGLKPGRSRRFAFERLAGFDAGQWAAMRGAGEPAALPEGLRFYGSDRDAGAVRMAAENAARAGVSGVTAFTQTNVSEIVPPPGSAGLAGLVIVNPPYGGRIGERTQLAPLYRTLGQVLRERFGGWRVGLVTSDRKLAEATRLRFASVSGPIDHGGIGVRLYCSARL